MNNLAGFLPFVLIALVFWFLIVRPQRRRQQELASTQSSLGVGIEVMLGSGIYGTVVSVEDDTIHLELAPGTTVKVARQAVVKVLSAGSDAPGGNGNPAPPTDEPDEGPADSGERHP